MSCVTLEGMEQQFRPIFLYGTLQPDSRGYGSTVAHAVIEHSPAYIERARLYIGSSYPMLRRDEKGGRVFGTIVLYEERLFDQILEDFDAYEGYEGEGRSDNMYLRQTLDVEVEPSPTWTGPNHVRAYVYVASDEMFDERGDEFILSSSGKWSHHAEEWEEATGRDE